MEKIKLTKDIKRILSVLNEHGKGYVVGGYIRDSLLGIEPKDCDFCTNIEYSKLKEIFKEYSPKEIGKSFGIIQIKYNGNNYEIAKLRKDVLFTTERNITEVEFVENIDEDLKRRDFTINAIAYDGEKLICFSPLSLEDIQNKVLRFVGEGIKRIEEDPLRILRGVRIASEKNISILFSTMEEMKEKKSEIKRVSIERIQDEFFRMLKGKNSSKGFELLNSLGIFQEIFPKTFKELDLKELLKKFQQLDTQLSNDLNLKLAIIFFKTKSELEILKLDKKTKKSILNILLYLDDRDYNKYEMKKIISKIGVEDFRRILILKSLNKKSNKEEILLDEILSQKEPIFLKDIFITGKDIIDLGITDGKEIKKYLEETLDLVLKYPKLNKKDYLIKRIEEEKV